jgi:glycosyltransferase involved in cell wall biosynthesis
MNDTFLIVAAFNEAERIETTLTALARAFPGAPVWVADDGSRDATAEIARRAGARVVRSERVIGKGAAATLAASAALEEARSLSQVPSSSDGPLRGAVFILCDGDLGESAEELSTLADAVRDGVADLAVAAFATSAGGGFGLALGFARWAIERRCGLRTRAPISGQRALSFGALTGVLPFAEGFGMEIGMTIDAVRAGCRLVEIVLDLEHRATGRTPAGFAHRARQLIDFLRAYIARRS